MLIESTGFLDALESSTVIVKKDLKKRKRLPSGSSSKNENTSKKEEPESPKLDVKPMKFYNDTLEENGDDEKPQSTEITNDTSSTTKENINDDIKNENKNDTIDKESKTDDSITVKKSDTDSKVIDEEKPKARPPGKGCGKDGPPGILTTHDFPRRKPKRSIRWRPDDSLISIKEFPLEENERINVTKTFTEQKNIEHNHERNALQNRREQDEEIFWRKLILIDNVTVIQYGYKSEEITVQAEREQNILQELFLEGRSMFDSPHEPDSEIVERKEPNVIPLEDVTGNTDSISNFKDIQWPTPKGEQPQYLSHGSFGNIFSSVNISSNLSIPPAPVLHPNAQLNPLAGLNLGAMVSPTDSAAINYMGILQAPFMQPPPMIQNNYQSSANYQSRGLNNNYSTGGSNGGSTSSSNNNNRNRAGASSGGSNWVRGNAATNLPRGICHQFQRTGFCRKRNAGCPYIHDR